MKKFDVSSLNKQKFKPVNPLIFQTAAEFAAQWFEVARSSGMPAGRYVGMGDKPIRLFVANHLEKFIPLAISILIEMLKPTSNCTAVMREAIYEALMDPINDGELMQLGKEKSRKEHEDLVAKAIRDFDKNKIGQLSGNTKVDLKGTSSLNHGELNG